LIIVHVEGVEDFLQKNVVGIIWRGQTSVEHFYRKSRLKGIALLVALEVFVARICRAAQTG
jgi:hypothetical protein